MYTLTLADNLTLHIDVDTNTYKLVITGISRDELVLYLTEEQFATIFDKYSGLYTAPRLTDSIKHVFESLNRLKEEELIILERTKQTLKPETEVNIYIKEHLTLAEQEEIVNACGEFMEALGFELKAEEEPIYNSFWQRLKFLFKRNVTEEDVDRVFKKGKQALELKHVDLPTAEQTEKLATAAEKLVSSLDKVSNGAIRLGALVVLKQTNDGIANVIIHQLTSDQVDYLNKNPLVIKDFNQLAMMIGAAKVQEEKIQVVGYEADSARIVAHLGSPPAPEVQEEA